MTTLSFTQSSYRSARAQLRLIMPPLPTTYWVQQPHHDLSKVLVPVRVRTTNRPTGIR